VSNRSARLLLSCLLLPLLSACGGGNKPCVDPEDPYLSARTNAPLRVPDGMTTPDRSAALVVPDAGASTAAPATRTQRSGCLAEAPSYFRSAGTVARSPEEVVASWAQAWAHREADAVIELYSTTFVAPTDSSGSAAWLQQRHEQVATGPVPDSMIEGLKIDQVSGDKRVATFKQHFGTNILNKELTLIRESGSWRIVAEKVW